MKKLTLLVALIGLLMLQLNIFAMHHQTSSHSMGKTFLAGASIIAGLGLIAPYARYFLLKRKLESKCKKIDQFDNDSEKETYSIKVMIYAMTTNFNPIQEQEFINKNLGKVTVRTLSGLGLIGVGAYHLFKK